MGISDEVFYAEMSGGGVSSGGGGGGGGGGGDSDGAEVEEKKEKTAFNVKVKSFDSSSKIKMIKAVRAITGLGLKEVL